VKFIDGGGNMNFLMYWLNNWQFWILGAPEYHALILVLVLAALWKLHRINQKLDKLLKR